MDVITELQQQRESLKQNIHDMDESIKKLTGRDPAESRRLSASKRIQLKRNSFGSTGDNQANKRPSTERRRWGNTALTRANNLDSGGEEQEEKKPAVQSSVVVTGKPIEPPRPVSEDNVTKKRNKRMFGLLMGTLKQFKQDSQVKTEQEAKREEKLIKVEEQVQKDKEDAVVERRELFQSRRGKQQELRNIEFKIEMAELNEELKSYYDQIQDFIQLKSTPRIFYKPAEHNEKTSKLLKESQESFQESLHQRMKEIAMCTEEDLVSTGRPFRRSKQSTSGKSAKDPIIIDQAPSKRDLFAEDADIDQLERADVIMEDTVEPVLVTDDTSVQEVSVNIPADEVIITEIESTVTNDDTLLEEVKENVDEVVLDPPELVKDVHVDVFDLPDDKACNTFIQDVVDPVLNPNEVDQETVENEVVTQIGIGGCENVDEDEMDVNVQQSGEKHNDDVRNVIESERVNVDEECKIDEFVEECVGDDAGNALKSDLDEVAELDEGGRDENGPSQEVDGHCEERHSNIFEQLCKSNLDDKDELTEDNEEQSKIDDYYLHDEYAAQLLEQVVDEGRAAALGNSYNVVDERISKINKKMLALQNTKILLDGKTENLNDVTNSSNTDDYVQKEKDLSPGINP